MVVQLVSRVLLFATSWPALCRASLSFTVSQSLLKLMSIESMIPSKSLILCCSLLLLPSFKLFQHQGLFQWVSSLYQVTKVLEVQLQHQSFHWTFGIDWFDLLAVQGTLKSLLQHHSSNISIIWCPAFFVVQLSHPYMTTRKTIALTRQTFAF